MNIQPHEHFDAVVIGCGMSGLAAGIRLALFNKNVLILERHNAPGGLNSFYSFQGRKFDVGLHALTNYVRKGVKGTPLSKLLRQLRIDYDAFDLNEQLGSRIAFPEANLRFNNDFSFFEAEIASHFPSQIDNFRKLLKLLHTYNELDLAGEEQSAREIVERYLTDPLLVDMIFCPLMYYGSAQENDMDFSQFVIMFKSIFCEGFSRPFNGVRTIIRVLLNKYRSLSGKRKMKCGVKALLTQKNRVKEILLADGNLITADHVLSSIGLVETLRLCDDQPPAIAEDNIGRLSFVETVTILSKAPQAINWEDTIIFFNSGKNFEYACPEKLVDIHSGVICFPNNYAYPDNKAFKEGIFRITALANFNKWTSLPPEEYQQEKAYWYQQLTTQARKFLPPLKETSLKDITVQVDMFTPKTIKKYTGHLGGAVYGAPCKEKEGRTHLENLYICGTDQGFLGIIGAMLSGISMANMHILSKN